MDNKHMNASSDNGELIYATISAIAELDAEAGTRHQKAGIAAATYKGRRPLNKAKTQQVTSLVKGCVSVSKVCQKIGIGRASYYNRK